jgi:DNA repair protein RadD
MELRFYQREACDATWAYLCSQAGNPVNVLPTGAGKSIVIAELCRAAVQQFAGRVIVLAHRSELLKQNAEKIERLLPPEVRVGIYSAGLGQRSTGAEVVCAGIQSVFRRAEEFGERHLVLIDEVHLVPHDGEGMYRTFLDRLREINPKLRMVGLTATPYRTGEGSVCRADGLFQKICYEANIPELIKGGFLSPIVSRPAEESVDTSGLHVRSGEFVPSEVEQLFDRKVATACDELVAAAAGRRSVLVFCSGVSHATHVAEYIQVRTGEPVGVVTGGTPPLERAGILSRFRSGTLRWLCNVDVLTTGFDAPCIDAIGILRATLSPGLFAQMCGRGFRLSPGKADCLVLDFGENIKRHGPLDAIDFGKRKSQGRAGDAPEKTCPNCEEPAPAAARACGACGFAFPPRELKHGESPDAETPILSEPVVWLVEEVRFTRHRKKKAEPDQPDTLRVDYLCTSASGGTPETISEWVCLEHEGWARRRAVKWWAERSHAPVGTIDQAIDLWLRGAFAAPTRLVARKEGRFWRIVSQELDPKPETWEEVAPEDVFEESPF